MCSMARVAVFPFVRPRCLFFMAIGARLFRFTTCGVIVVALRAIQMPIDGRQVFLAVASRACGRFVFGGMR